jgi:hypothetical protein
MGGGRATGPAAIRHRDPWLFPRDAPMASATQQIRPPAGARGRRSPRARGGSDCAGDRGCRPEGTHDRRHGLSGQERCRRRSRMIPFRKSRIESPSLRGGTNVVGASPPILLSFCNPLQTTWEIAPIYSVPPQMESSEPALYQGRSRAKWGKNCPEMGNRPRVLQTDLAFWSF